ncbi:hypothetical protein OHS33_29175 [Streptomyces sp. NBC_00536]|uniref:hypothetical protein n=1 Tax=Streptomyces sp. NBC_00536 TaxID=2975769 RepID=UPI002E80B904|nr:hypothetical protein [Streptomyces sp. NBC_00536]WUC82061.1 hypothetical protein OHS33_29175 [Streptomyces sp. NBC_00536]
MTGTTGTSLPSRHQRRILICVGEPEAVGHAGGRGGHAGGHPDVYAATARWQRQYVGGVYVRVTGTPERQRAVVARFTAAGCTLQATHFYRPADVGALASLARQLQTLPAEVLAAEVLAAEVPAAEGEFDPVRVAELLMVGATDVVGPYPQRYMAAARAAASFVNDRLGEAWLALPMVTRAEGTACATGGTHTPGGHGSLTGCTEGELEDHFADTARALAAETESRLEVLDRLPTRGESVPCPAAALSE